MQNDELREMLADAYATGATDVHNSWVAGTNGGEPDFGESASDYATSIELPDTITALQAEVARLREEKDAATQEAERRIVEWLREEAMLCDCFAREESECACGAWDDYKQVSISTIIDAIEQGAHHDT